MLGQINRDYRKNVIYSINSFVFNWFKALINIHKTNTVIINITITIIISIFIVICNSSHEQKFKLHTYMNV